jgi:hypothetical protein
LVFPDTGERRSKPLLLCKFCRLIVQNEKIKRQAFVSIRSQVGFGNYESASLQVLWIGFPKYFTRKILISSNNLNTDTEET